MRIGFLVVILAAALCVSEANKFKLHRVSVRNNVLPSKAITVRCKSRDDDLGDQILQPGQAWGFKFRPSFWGTTLFTCRFQWSENDFHMFEIWDERNNSPVSKCNTCIWTIRKDGPCRFNGDTHAYMCFPWMKF